MTSSGTPACNNAMAQLLRKRWEVIRRPLRDGHCGAACFARQIEAARDAIVAERSAPAIGEDELLGRNVVDDAPASQASRGLRPQRHLAFLATLSVKKNDVVVNVARAKLQCL